MRSDWTRCTHARPCPLCGATKLCSVRVDGAGPVAVFCRDRREPKVTGDDGGVYLRGVVRDYANVGEMAVYDREGCQRAAPEDMDQRRQERAAQAKMRRAGEADGRIKLAQRIWSQAYAGHAMVAGYLEHRGIRVADLPGGVIPASLRYHPACPESRARAPEADLAPVRELISLAGASELAEADRLTGGTYEAPAGTLTIEWRYTEGEGRTCTASLACPAVVSAIQPPAEAMGIIARPTAVHRIYLEPTGEPRKRAWPLLDAKKALGLVAGGGVWVRGGREPATLIVAEGIETMLACVAATGCSGAACISAVGMEQLELPAAGDWRPERVIIASDFDAPKGKGSNRMPRGQVAAGRCAVALRAARPGLRVDVRLPAEVLGPHQIAWYEGTERMDRPGELVHVGVPIPASADGIDWLDVLAQHGGERTAKALTNDVARVTLPAPASAPLDAGGHHDGSGGGRAGPPGGSGGSGGNGDHAGGAGGRWIPARHVDRAKMYLLDRCVAPGGRRFSLAWIEQGSAAGWYHWCGTHWRPMVEEKVAAMVRRWGWEFLELTKGGNEREWNPKSHDIYEMLHAAKSLTWSVVDDRPAWLPDDFDGEGTPTWAGADRFDPSPLGSRPRPDRLLSFANGVLDLDELLSRKVRLRPHDPALFVSNSLPYPVPVDDLRELVEGDMAPEDAEELYERRCPALMRVLRSASDGDPEWITCCQAMLGDLMTWDRRLEKIFLFQGQRRAGKGTLIEAIISIVGQEAVGFTGLADLADKFELAPLVGLKVAVMADAHSAEFGDGARAVERMKSISGGDYVRIRDLYTKADPFVKLRTRFAVFVNDLPTLSDSSTALAGRMIILPMAGSHFGREDLGLKPAVREQSAGNALFALMGYLQTWWMPRPAIMPPEASRQIMREFEESTSPTMQFLREECEVWAESDRSSPIEEWSVSAQAFAEAYGKWAKGQGRLEKGVARLGRELRPLVPGLQVRAGEGLQRGTVYYGVRLRGVAGYGPTEPWYGR